MTTTYNFLHEYFNGLTRHTFPYYEQDISKNGIYILFERGETFNGFDRVVRIGSHTGTNRLFERLNEHYVCDDHRDSIFRKHLGRCFLTIDNKIDYIVNWNLKIKRRTDKAKNLCKINSNFEKMYEAKITNYVQNNFSFVIIPNLTNETERLRLERGLIATFAHAENKIASDTWLGNYHPDIKIRNSKLWNIHHLSSQPLTNEEIKKLEKHIKLNKQAS